MSQFFLQYNNATYPTVAEVKTSVIALLKPPNKLLATRSASSEIMATTLASASEFACSKRSEYKYRCNWKRCSPCCYNCCLCCKRKKRRPIPRAMDMPSRPMYRDDIFYAGSIATLPEYQKSYMLRPPEVVSF